MIYCWQKLGYGTVSVLAVLLNSVNKMKVHTFIKCEYCVLILLAWISITFLLSQFFTGLSGSWYGSAWPISSLPPKIISMTKIQPALPRCYRGAVAAIKSNWLWNGDTFCNSKQTAITLEKLTALYWCVLTEWNSSSQIGFELSLLVWACHFNFLVAWLPASPTIEILLLCPKSAIHFLKFSAIYICTHTHTHTHTQKRETDQMRKGRKVIWENSEINTFTSDSADDNAKSGIVVKTHF